MVVDDGDFDTLSLHRLPQFAIDVSPTAEEGLERTLIDQYSSFDGSELPRNIDFKGQPKIMDADISPVSGNSATGNTTDGSENDLHGGADIPCFDCTDEADKLTSVQSDKLISVQSAGLPSESKALRVAMDDARSIVDDLTRIVSTWHSTAKGTPSSPVTPDKSAVYFQWSPSTSSSSSGTTTGHTEDEEQIVQELLQQVDFVMSDVVKLRSGLSSVQSQVRNRSRLKAPSLLHHGKSEQEQGQEQDFIPLDDKWVRFGIVCAWLTVMFTGLFFFYF